MPLFHKEDQTMKLSNIWVYLLLIFLLMGCSNAQSNINDSTLTKEVGIDLPARTEQINTSTIEPTLPIIHTPVTTIRPIATATQNPTLHHASSEEVQSTISELLEDNGGCDLPCWWGVHPGETSWEDASNFLDSLNTEIYESGNPNEVLLVETTVLTDATIKLDIEILLLIKRQIVDYIKIREIDHPSFELASFLQDHGVPDEVWIHSFPSYMGDLIPFHLFLFYRDKGFYADFIILNEDEIEYKDNWINACITQGPELVLGASNPTISFTQFSKNVSEDWGDELHSIVSVEDAMGITPKQFYEQYKSGEQKCFKVDRYLWPEP